MWLQRDRDNRLARDVAAQLEGRVPVHRLPRRQLDALFPQARHQGVVVRARVRTATGLAALLTGLAPDADPLLVVLDGVQDPHNLGAVMRTADAAGASGVVVPRSRGVGLTASARKVASGAAEHLALVQVSNLSRALTGLGAAGALSREGTRA